MLGESVVPRQPNVVDVEVRDVHGRVKQKFSTTNLRTDAGADFQKNQMSGTAGAVANYIGVSNDNTAASAAHTTMAGEQTTDGLARAAGTFNGGAAGSTSYTLQKTFTYAGAASITLYKAGMFNAAAAGTLVFEALFGTAATLATNDQITISWQVSI